MNGISVIATFFAWCDPRRNPGTDGIARYIAQHRVYRTRAADPDKSQRTPPAAAPHAAAGPGTQAWIPRYNGTGNDIDGATSVAVSHTGGTVFVTGSSAGATTGDDYITIGYSG